MLKSGLGLWNYYYQAVAVSATAQVFGAYRPAEGDCPFEITRHANVETNSGSRWVESSLFLCSVKPQADVTLFGSNFLKHTLDVVPKEGDFARKAAR